MSLADKLKNGGSIFTRYDGNTPTPTQRTINGYEKGTTPGRQPSELHKEYSINNNPSLNPKDLRYIQTPDSDLPIPSGLDNFVPTGITYTTHYSNGEKLNSRYGLGANNPSGTNQTGGVELP